MLKTLLECSFNLEKGESHEKLRFIRSYTYASCCRYINIYVGSDNQVRFYFLSHFVELKESEKNFPDSEKPDLIHLQSGVFNKLLNITLLLCKKDTFDAQPSKGKIMNYAKEKLTGKGEKISWSSA